MDRFAAALVAIVGLLIAVSGAASADAIVVADANGPYQIVKSGDTLIGTVTLDGSGSWSDAAAGPIAAWAWDLENDGLYDDAFGVTPTLPASYWSPAPIGSVLPVKLRVMTTLGHVDFDSTVLQVVEGQPPVPEPATLGLLGMAGLFLLRRRRTERV